MENKGKKILIVGGGVSGLGTSALMLQTLKEKYGDDIILVSPEEEKQQRLTENDFANIPSMKITAPPIMQKLHMPGAPKSGQENRRERRKNNRKK